MNISDDATCIAPDSNGRGGQIIEPEVTQGLEIYTCIGFDYSMSLVALKTRMVGMEQSTIDYS